MSTASMNNLPNELLEIIFAKLAIRDVFRTETTCKKWKILLWSSQSDIIFPYCNTHLKIFKAVTAAIHKILTAADPIKIRKLDLSLITYKLNEQDIAALKKMKSLNSLSIDFTDMTKERCSFIPHLTNLQHLSLNNKLIQECIDVVGSAHLPHLTSLAIISRPLSNLSPLLNLTRVKALDLQACRISDTNGVIALFTTLTQLNALNIAYVKGIVSEDVFGSLSCLTNLTDLSLSSAPVPRMNGAVLNKVLSALSKLKSLDMNHLSSHNDETIRIISNMSDLTKLVIFFNSYTPSKILSKLTNMQHLTLSTSTDRATDKFFRMMTNLTSLNTPMSDSDFRHFEHLTHLKCLSINNRYHINGSFYRYVLKMTQLEHLDFQTSELTSVVQIGSLSSLQFLTHIDVQEVRRLNIEDMTEQLTQLTNLRSLRTSCELNVDWLLKLTNLELLDMSFPRNKSNDNQEVTLLTPLLGMTKLVRLSMMFVPCLPENVEELFRNHRNLTALRVNCNDLAKRIIM